MQNGVVPESSASSPRVYKRGVKRVATSGITLFPTSHDSSPVVDRRPLGMYPSSALRPLGRHVPHPPLGSCQLRIRPWGRLTNLYGVVAASTGIHRGRTSPLDSRIGHWWSVIAPPVIRCHSARPYQAYVKSGILCWWKGQRLCPNN